MKKKYSIFEKLTTFKLLFAVLVLNGLSANATRLDPAGAVVTTNSGSGLASSYGTLDAAITALNAATITSPVVITLNSPQTAPVGGYAITASGTATNTITITGNNNVITANAAQTVGSISDAIFKLVGADYITLSNFTMIENPANTVSTTALTNNMTEWGVAVLYATTTNGAQNNTIIDNTISLNRTYTSTFGVYCSSFHAAGTPSTSATATTAAGSNTGLSVLGNTITNVCYGVIVVGPSAAADHNQQITIGNAAKPNIITDFGTNTPLSNFSGLLTTSAYGIYVRNTDNFSVSYNTLTSSNGGFVGTAFRGIYIPAANNAPIGTLTQAINNNIISLRPGASATIFGISVEATTGNATTTLSISNNDFNNTTHTVAATSAITFISNLMANLNVAINNNTFTNMSVNTSGSVNFIANSVAHPVNAAYTVNNNRIVTGFLKTTAGGTVSFYNSASTTAAGTANENNNGNDFSNIGVNGATIISGWVNTAGATTSPFGPTKTVTNNTFGSIVGGSSSTNIITVGNGYANGNSVVSNNTINAVSTSGTIVGITSAQGVQTFSGNSITNLVSTVSGIVSGMSITGGLDQTVTKNKIASIEVNNAAGSVNGLLVSSGTLVKITNNLIGDLRAPIRNSATDGVRGISITSTAATSNINVYHNTIAIGATSTGADFSASGLFHTVSATATTAVLDLRNNIIVNSSTASGTGTSVAIRRSGVALNNFASTSNNNDLVGTAIMADGTTTYATTATYQAFVAPREANSISTAANFLSLVASNPNFLHIDASIASQIESGGSVIATVPDDIDGEARQGAVGYTGTGTAPDMGADEFNGTLATVNFDNIATFNAYPNPTSGVLNINATKEITSVSVINLLGQTISNQKVSGLDVQVDLSSLSRATYLVKVIAADGQEKVLKVVKQ